MLWFNLKKNKCPSCGKDLTSSFDATSNLFKCPCGFTISTMKMKQIISNMVTKDLDQFHKDMEEERKGWE